VVAARYHKDVLETGINNGEHPGAVLRRLRHTAGRRVSQQALAELLGTSRAHVARLELHGYPTLTDDQLDRLERARDAVRPPFSSGEIDELRKANRSVGAAAIRQADKAVRDIAGGGTQIFPLHEDVTPFSGDRPDGQHRATPPAVPDPFESSSRPMFLTGISEVVDAAIEDIKHLTRQRQASGTFPAAAKPDLIITNFWLRNLVDQAEEPETFRDAIREALRAGATVEVLIAPSATDAARDLVAVVPPMISYLGHAQDDHGYQVHVMSETRQPLAYGVFIAGDRGLLIAHGTDGRAVAIRTNDPHDVAALRDLVRPHWEGRKPIIEQAGRRTPDSVAGRSQGPSIRQRFEDILTSVEVEEGPRRLAKEGLSILNIPVAIHAWKWRAAELCTAGWVPEDLLEILHAHAGKLAAHGLGQLPDDVLAKYPPGSGVRETLEALEEYARGLQVRQAAWGDQLSRHDFWDACTKSALRRFIRTGELPRDEIPSACKYAADPDDVETIITRLIARLRSNRNYHLVLIDKSPVPHWFYFEVKANHVLAQVFDNPAGETLTGAVGSLDENMLSVHIDYEPIAAAFAGWFDEHVLKPETKPPWHDNRSVAKWLEDELRKSKNSRKHIPSHQDQIGV
jgi:hypothetical protein